MNRVAADIGILIDRWLFLQLQLSLVYLIWCFTTASLPQIRHLKHISTPSANSNRLISYSSFPGALWELFFFVYILLSLFLRNITPCMQLKRGRSKAADMGGHPVSITFCSPPKCLQQVAIPWETTLSLMNAKSHDASSVTRQLQLLWGIKDTVHIPKTFLSISLPADRATLPRVPSGGREQIRGTKCKAQKTYFIIPSLAHTWWETLKGVNIFNTVCVYIKNVIYTNLHLLRCINLLHGLELVRHAFLGETEKGHQGLKNLLLCFPCPKWLEKNKKKWMCFSVMRKKKKKEERFQFLEYFDQITRETKQ